MRATNALRTVRARDVFLIRVGPVMHTFPLVLELGLRRKAAFSVPGAGFAMLAKALKNKTLLLLTELLCKEAEEVFLVCEDIVKNLVIRAKRLPLDFALQDPG